MQENIQINSFESFYESQYDRVVRFVRSRRFDYPQAEDIISRIFEIAWKRFSEYKSTEVTKKEYWILRIAENMCKHERRKSIKSPEAYVADMSIIEHRLLERGTKLNGRTPEKEMLDKELYGKYLGAVNRLPRRYREVFLLRAADYTYDEIGKLLGISGQAAHGRMDRALKKHSRLFFDLLEEIKRDLH